jgi:hypothetical protein
MQKILQKEIIFNYLEIDNGTSLNTILKLKKFTEKKLDKLVVFTA